MFNFVPISLKTPNTKRKIASLSLTNTSVLFLILNSCSGAFNRLYGVFLWHIYFAKPTDLLHGLVILNYRKGVW
jgi:hypothetical protein